MLSISDSGYEVNDGLPHHGTVFDYIKPCANFKCQSTKPNSTQNIAGSRSKKCTACSAICLSSTVTSRGKNLPVPHEPLERQPEQANEAWIYRVVPVLLDLNV